MENKKFLRKCSKEKIECKDDTINFGLCVNKKKSKLCNSINVDYFDKNIVSLPELHIKDFVEYNNDIIKGKEKGYFQDNFIKPCINNINDNKNLTIIKNKKSSKIPEEFSIITINAMGIYRDNDPIIINKNGSYSGKNSTLLLMSLRAKILRDFLNNNEPDIICFQEMSQEFFNFLYIDILKKIYPYYFEKNLGDLIQNRNKDIEVFIISKYNPGKISIYQLTGNLNYTDSLAVYEFSNLIVINVYLQAGSKSSPGQKYFWKDYSRCRSQQIKFIKNIIDSYKNKPIILLGDFNFDLNSIYLKDNKDWPEANILNNIGLQDSWFLANINSKSNLGLTENTEINTLRWNSKLENKMFRYDGIFSNDKLEILDSKVILNEGYSLDDKYTKAYEDIIIPNRIKKDPKLLSKIKKNKFGKYDIFVSDHFGVMSKFKINKISKKISKKTTKK